MLPLCNETFSLPHSFFLVHELHYAHPSYYPIIISHYSCVMVVRYIYIYVVLLLFFAAYWRTFVTRLDLFFNAVFAAILSV